MLEKSGVFSSQTDVSLGVFGQFTPSRVPVATSTLPVGTSIQQTIQGASISAGVLGAFHQSFRPWLGYNVNFGYSRLHENYSEGTVYTPNGSAPPSYTQHDSFMHGSIGTNVYELTATYVVQGPKSHRLTTFAQLGGGTLAFLPTQDPSPYAVQFRSAMVFGAGINYRLSEHFGLRGEYRGLFYKNPDFSRNGPFPTTKLFTVTNEPTLSMVYAFGFKKKVAKRF